MSPSARLFHAKRPRLRTILMAGATLAASGCGFLFVSGPPPEATSGYIPCTDSKALAHLDAVMAGLQVVNIIYTASLDDFEYADSFGETSKGTVIAVQAGFGALWGFSARSGYRKVDACRAARAAATAGDQAAALREEASSERRSTDGWRPPMLLPTSSR